VITFVIENYEEIFTNDVKPAVAKSSIKPSPSQLLLGNKLNGERKSALTNNSYGFSKSRSNSKPGSRSGSDSESERSSVMVIDAQSNGNTSLNSNTNISNSPNDFNNGDNAVIMRSASNEDMSEANYSAPPHPNISINTTTNNAPFNFRKNLTLISPFDLEALSLDMDFESSSSQHGSNGSGKSQPQNYSEAEWKVQQPQYRI